MSSQCPLIVKNCRFVLMLLLVWGGLPCTVSAATAEGIGAGELLFRTNGQEGDTTAHHQKANRALHLKSSAEFRINGLIAHVTLEQTFRNDSDEWREGVYVLPMHELAAVNEMEMRIGERIIRAQIKEKLAARKIYQAANAAGKKAALVEQSRPNMFQQAVANIAPGESIVIRLSYVQPVDYDSGTFSFRFPMTITPRYMPGTTTIGEAAAEMDLSAVKLSPNTMGWALATTQVPDAPLISPPMSRSRHGEVINPISLSVSLDPGLPLMEVSSDYHDISVKKEADRYAIGIVGGVVSMDRDFVLNWRPVVGSEPRAAVFRESIAGSDYLLLMVLPPDEMENRQGAHVSMARDIVFVIDTSGSMQGSSIDQAKSSLQRAMKGLRPQDRFNIVEFNSHWSRLFDSLQSVDPYHLNMADNWISALVAGGGTEMYPALKIAIDTQDTESPNLKQIVFITDGAVGNERGLFDLIHQQLGDIRLFPVGIGSAPNSFFMRQAAKFGAGSFTHIGSLQEVGQRMDQLFEKIDSPLVTDLNINWLVEAESYPQKLPTLYRGEPLVIVAKAEALGDEIHIRGITAALPWSQTVSLSGTTSQPGVGTLWARKKIESLEDQRVREGESDELKSAMTAVALQHRLVSRYTSLVAVEALISRLPEDPSKPTAVRNAVAHGQSMQTAPYPRTSTSGSLSFLIGLFALVLLVSVNVLKRTRVI